MEIQTMFTKSIGFQKTAFASTMALISTVQEHGEALMKTTLEQSPWLPESSKKVCLFWADVCTQNMKNMKVLVDQGLIEMEKLSAMSPNPGKDKPRKAAATGQSSAHGPAQQTPANRKKATSSKKSIVAKTAPGKKATLQKSPTEKPAPPVKKPADIKAVQEKPAAQQSAAIKTVTSKPETSVPPNVISVTVNKETV